MRGSCAGSRTRVHANAAERASVNPERSAISNPTVACDTNPSSAAVASNLGGQGNGLHQLLALHFDEFRLSQITWVGSTVTGGSA